MGRGQHSGQALKSPHIVGLFCPYSRSLLTLGWSTQAELICRAAAAAAEKNLKGNKSHSLSLSASRSSSPAATSDKSLGSQASQGPESDSRRLRLNLIIPQVEGSGLRALDLGFMQYIYICMYIYIICVYIYIKSIYIYSWSPLILH